MCWHSFLDLLSATSAHGRIGVIDYVERTVAGSEGEVSLDILAYVIVSIPMLLFIYFFVCFEGFRAATAFAIVFFLLMAFVFVAFPWAAERVFL